MIRFWTILCACIAVGLLESNAQTSDTLYLTDFQSIVLNHYPLIKKADLYNEISEAYLLKGKGTLDPKFYSDYDRKDFKNINYFSRWYSEVKIPTALPVDFSVGYENNSGAFLSNEATVPSNGLLYGSLNISLLRGLMFDEQRYNLQAAELSAEKSQIDNKILLREINFQALTTYIEWAAAYYNFLRYQEYESAIILRHQNIISLYENGDKPAIDTIESRVNWNTATKEKLSAYNYYLQKRQKLNLFLWDDEANPVMLNNNVLPQSINSVATLLREYSIIDDPNWSKDPLIRKQQNQIQAIDLENRLVNEMLKPQLDVKLNTIYNLGEDNLQLVYSINDYKLGAALEIPLRNRKAKGEIQLNNAIKEQIRLDQEYYESKLRYDYLQLFDRQANNDRLIANATNKIQNSQLLYDAESLKFQLGESSIFLLNQRERKLLESKIEAIKAYKAQSLVLSQLYYLEIGQQ